MGRYLWVGVIAGLCGVSALVWAFSPNEPPRVTVRHVPDIAFTGEGEETLRLDLAMPAQGDGPFPAVVCIHGGGWTGGERKQMAGTIEALARRGYVAIAPDYRLAPKHRFPACIQDCKAAVRWLRANAAEYKVDASNIGAVGLSAGGHLACLLAMTRCVAELEGTGCHAEHSSDVQAVVGFAAPTDLTAPAIHTEKVLKLNLVPLLGGAPATLPQAYRQASPLSYNAQGAPPMLLIHGSADPVAPVQQAHDLATKVRDAGGTAVVQVLEGEGHTWGGSNLLWSIARMLHFLDETLKK